MQRRTKNLPGELEKNNGERSQNPPRQDAKHSKRRITTVLHPKQSVIGTLPAAGNRQPDRSDREQRRLRLRIPNRTGKFVVGSRPFRFALQQL
jgi:hypothetical protein